MRKRPIHNSASCALVGKFNNLERIIDHQPNIATLFLAAGASRRMGQSKQLLKITDNQTLIEHSILAATNSASQHITVVLGANALRIQKVLSKKPLAIDTIINKQWEKGMGSTLSVGLEYLLEQQPKLDAIIISVSDQPYLSSIIFNQLIEQYINTQQPIICSDYGDRLGVPALLDQQFFPQLLSLQADEGARGIIRSNRTLVTSVPFPKGAIDLDTPQAYKAYLSSLNPLKD